MMEIQRKQISFIPAGTFPDLADTVVENCLKATRNAEFMISFNI